MPPKKRTSNSSPPADAIRVTGARQNNLKGLDLDIPLGQLTVVTGPSGSGKSSLAFQTLYAEGQRRYVETFSPYVRQFFDRMDKPAVDRIDGIPPAIAIEQKNNVRTTRSTVGTITEVNDYLKLLFARQASAVDPSTGDIIRPDTTDSIAAWCDEHLDGRSALVLFPVPVPPDTDPAELFSFLQQQGYLRILLHGDIHRTDEPTGSEQVLLLPSRIHVIQDRLTVSPHTRPRLLEALERALELGKGSVSLVEIPESSKLKTAKLQTFTTNWTNPKTNFSVRPPTPSLFTFNNPHGACPECRGFGRVIGIDLAKAVPDPSLSIKQGCVKPFLGDRGEECQRDLLRTAAERGIDLDCPYFDLLPDEQDWVLYGERDDPEDAWQNGEWYGVKGFFDWLEGKSYKMHVRIFLSRYRSYTTCGKCRGTRLQPEALVFQIDGHTLPDLWQIPVSDLTTWFDQLESQLRGAKQTALGSPKGAAGKTRQISDQQSQIDKTTELVLSEITSRLGYLNRVGLGYLTLDRPTRTLSGGEVERVNLTTCLGAALTNTLFVLDEPTVGLHPRDIDALVGVMHGLRDKGNTLVVVEHEETVMRAADHLIDIGPGAGEHGGELVYEGPPPTNQQSIIPNPQSSISSRTLSYLTGEAQIEIPSTRRKPKKFISIRGATRHNIRKLDADVPLGVFCCVTGVSGSGKSTFVHDVLYQNLARQFGIESESDAAPVRSLKIPKTGKNPAIGSVAIVDQSPLSRTPRSTPVVYIGAFDHVRQLFASSPDGKLAGLTPGYFSFNSGAGRCERCSGNGFEKVEMQFLSDLYLTCPECRGSRYNKAALEFTYGSKTISDILKLTVTEAVAFFSQGAAATEKRAASQEAGRKLKIVQALQPLQDLGLGYLRLGQPLNTLSGGEAQRLKLCTILSESTGRQTAKGRISQIANPKSALLILDEPTTGLHFGDIERLLAVFQRLVDAGQSLIVIEHNLDVIKSADHLIDLGPGPGTDGGQVVATGTPEQVAATDSETARFLAPLLRGCGVPPQAVPAASRRKGSANTTLKAAEPTPQYPTPEIPDPNRHAITISGAREHNLKNIDLVIPHNEFVVVTGLSGSGKSTLAFDIIFAEGQRRFLDSMSPYARQFAEQMEKPDVDRIHGLPPTVAIEQRISRGGGKSTVATVTEIYHFLRLLYAKLGIQHCPESGVPVVPQTEDAIVEVIRKHRKDGPVSILAPLIRGRKGFHTDVAAWAGRNGYTRLLVDSQWKDVDGFQRLERFKEHDLDVEVMRLSSGRLLIADLRQAVTDALHHGKGTLRLLDHKNKLHVFSKARVSPVTGRSFEPLEPAQFSYNSPRGWCPTCRGYGEISASKRRRFDSRNNTPYNSITEAEIDFDRKLDKADDDELIVCPECDGARLNEVSRAVRLGNLAIHEIARLPVTAGAETVAKFKFTGRDAAIARDILPEIQQRLGFLAEVGLAYLQLDRSAKTLSGGEAQRIRLAAQLGSNLRGVLYVLDEPTIGLHPRDNQALLNTLDALRAKGNSLLVVEHDDDTMHRAGHIIDLGPAAGRFGGEVIASGTVGQIKKLKASVTGHALKNPLAHPVRGERRSLPKVSAAKGWLKLKGCHLNNLKGIDTRIPTARLTVISGISGCGKSSLMRGTLGPAAKAAGKRGSTPKKTWKSAAGFKQIKSCFEVDQSPIGKTSRSCPATYVKLFDEIRKLFSQLPDARLRGFDASRFSFNNEPGRCPECKGNGRIKLEMDFLPSTWTHCDACNGKRYNPATLEVRYSHKSIGDVLEMTIDEAAAFFETHPRLQRPLQLLADTGLGYLQLGQPSPTLSGGEAQRLKLVTELTKGRSIRQQINAPKLAPKNLYLIEEPSIGLHLEDVKKLIDVLHRLVDEGHTVVVIEHHTGIMAEADFLIDMGPEAGEAGGKIVTQGPPEHVAKSKTSRTAPFLRQVL